MNINNKLKLSLIINTAFAILEFSVGTLAGSLALVSDAAHNLTDSLSILIAYIGQKIASRPATEEHTFGYGKATILTALVNSLLLMAIAGYILFESYQRILHPQATSGGIIMVVAAIGIAVNGGVAAMFVKNRGDLNLRSVFLNMAFDAIVSLGAAAAGLIIYLTHSSLADPVISIAIAGMLIFGAAQIINKAVHIFLEGVPEHMDIKKIRSAILENQEVRLVDDLHVWSIGSQKCALNCRIIFHGQNLEKNLLAVEQIKQMLKDKFDINHAAIETALKPAPPHQH